MDDDTENDNEGDIPAFGGIDDKLQSPNAIAEEGMGESSAIIEPQDNEHNPEEPHL